MTPAPTLQKAPRRCCWDAGSGRSEHFEGPRSPVDCKLATTAGIEGDFPAGCRVSDTDFAMWPRGSNVPAAGSLIADQKQRACDVRSAKTAFGSAAPSNPNGASCHAAVVPQPVAAWTPFSIEAHLLSEARSAFKIDGAGSPYDWLVGHRVLRKKNVVARAH